VAGRSKDPILLKEAFLKKAKNVHGDKYDYQFVEYKDNKVKVKIICPHHGEFYQAPNHHTSGRECSACGSVKTAKKLEAKLDDCDIEYIRQNINNMTMYHFKEKFGLHDGVIRKIMKKNNIKPKSSDYGPIYEDISKQLWGNLRSGAKSRNLIVEISPQDIWETYIKQDKKCALSGMPIKFGHRYKGETTASVDRIDSKLGYTKNNIQIVHKLVNKIKTDLPQSEFIDLCIKIASNFNGRSN
jgi:hypothetical protein